MSALDRLVDKHLRELSGAEFKVAAYLYRRLERRQQVEMTIAELGLAVGVSTKRSYSVLLKLRNDGLLQVASRRGQTSQFSLPMVSRSSSGRASPMPASSPAHSSLMQGLQNPGAPDRSQPLKPPASATRRVQAYQPDAPPNKPLKGATSVTERIQSSARLTSLPPRAGSEEEQCKQLASELTGGYAIDDFGIAELNAAMEGQSPRPGALLRRLQEYKQSGKTARDLHQLAYGVRELHWL